MRGIINGIYVGVPWPRSKKYQIPLHYFSINTLVGTTKEINGCFEHIIDDGEQDGLATLVLCPDYAQFLPDGTIQLVKNL